VGARGVRGWATRGLGWVQAVLDTGREGLADAARVTSFVRGSLEFSGRPDDVYIATYPRSGTTWMQFLVYLLTSDRRMDFDHISRVSPWFERCLALGTRTAEDYRHLPSPRIFKTHLRPEWVPSPGRVIYVQRDGRDVLCSYFHFYRSHLRFEGTFDEFFERFMTGSLQYRSWFDHVAAWKRAARRRSVLWVQYEAMRADMPATLDRLADYLEVDLDPAARDEVASMADYDFMKAHEGRFDPITEHLIDRRLLPGQFIRSGEAGAGKARLTPRQIERFETREPKTRRLFSVEPRLADFLH